MLNKVLQKPQLLYKRGIKDITLDEQLDKRDSQMALKRLNCWEFTECGREPGGKNTAALGICPAATEGRYDGINRGKNAGRFCWAVAGTFCNSEAQGTFAMKLENCLKCDFFIKVQKEEGRTFTFLPAR